SFSLRFRFLNQEDGEFKRQLRLCCWLAPSTAARRPRMSARRHWCRIGPNTFSIARGSEDPARLSCVEKEGVFVNEESTTRRRSFLTGMLGTAAAAGLSLAAARSEGAEDASGDAWIKEVKGTHRCLFDFPKHMNGFPLLHILNYLNTYSTVYKTTAGQVGAAGTFYGVGGASSIPLAFNDSMWAKYELGAYTGLKDSDGKPYARNVFHRPTQKELHLLMAAVDSPMIPAIA